MPRAPRRLLAALLVCLCAVIPTRTARAQFTLNRIGPSGGEVAAGVIGAGVVIGVVVYLVLRHPRITGCTTSAPGGLELRAEGGQPQTYLLTGDTTHLTPGQRIRISGKRHKDAAGHPTFKVESLKKVYGPCQSVQTSP